MKLTRNSKNIFSLFSVDLFTKFIGFLATTYLARVLGVSGFGIISIGLAVLAYVQLLSTGGLEITGTKKTASGTEDTQYLTGDIITTRFFLTAIVVVITYVILAVFVSSDEIRIVVLIYILFAFPSSLRLDWFFIGLQKMVITSAGRVTASITYLLIIMYLVKIPEDIIITPAAWVTGGIINTIFIWYFFRKYGYKIKLKINRLNKQVKLLKESLPLGLASLLSQIAIMFPTIYLGIVSSTSDAGIYSAAYKLVALLLIFDRVFITIFFPKIVGAISQTPQRLNEIFNRTLKIITIFAVSISVPIIIAGRLLIGLIFGDQFMTAGPIFQLMMTFFVLTLINSIFGYTLIGANREGSYLHALVISIIAFIISTVILYNYFFITGLVLALIVYEVIKTIIMFFKVKQSVSINSTIELILPILISGILLFVLLNIEIHFILKISASIIIGIPLVALSGGLNTEDIKFIKRLLI